MAYNDLIVMFVNILEKLRTLFCVDHVCELNIFTYSETNSEVVLMSYYVLKRNVERSHILSELCIQISFTYRGGS